MRYPLLSFRSSRLSSFSEFLRLTLLSPYAGLNVLLGPMLYLPAKAGLVRPFVVN